MSVASARFQVDTTAVKVASSGISAMRVVVRNKEASLAIVVGGPDVTTSNGFQLDAGESVGLTIGVSEELFIRAASQGAAGAVHVLTALK